MADGRADDQFERFYAEKLWELVPSIDRHEDGLAESPGTLRAVIELVAEQAALLRRSHDRLWEDAFIQAFLFAWIYPRVFDTSRDAWLTSAHATFCRRDIPDLLRRYVQRTAARGAWRGDCRRIVLGRRHLRFEVLSSIPPGLRTRNFRRG